MAENKKISKIQLPNGTVYDLKDPNTPSAVVFDGNYDPTTNKAATVSTVTDKINTLDGTISGSAGAGKTLTAFSQTDGKVSATFGNISITKSQISDYPGVEGTITGVSAGTGLSGGGTSGSVTLNHSNSVTAKTTQGLYPIKFDAQGHITGSGDAVTSLPASDVYAWAKESTKPSYTASEVGAIATSAKGANNGVAELDSTGKVPSAQLPSYVDDVLEYDSLSDFPSTGETGKIYVAKDTNLTYRWSGTAYVEISPSLALGETSSTAYYGDKGKIAYDHASAKGSAFSSGLYKITTNAQGHVTAASAVSKSDITSLGIPGSDTNTTYSISGALASHKFTSTLTPSSGSDTTSEITFAAGDNITLTDDTTNKKITISATDTTYESKAAASGGTALSLVTTGEKYTWNNKSDLTLGTTATTAAAGNHAHAISLTSDSAASSSITLAGSGVYRLTAGGNSVIFTMPSIPTLAVPTLATDTGTSSITLASNSKYKLTTSGGSVVFTMPEIATNWLNGSQTGSVRTIGSTAEDSNYTIGEYAVAEGWKTKASGVYSHAEGRQTTAEGFCSHTEGYRSYAPGDASHAEGIDCYALGDYSHAEGSFVEAVGQNSHVQGKYNIIDDTAYTSAAGTTFDDTEQYYIKVGGQYIKVENPISTDLATYYTYTPENAQLAFIIGNGTESHARSNALTVDWNGNVTANNYLATLTYTGTPPNATGADADLINSIYNLGWTDCIV